MTRQQRASQRRQDITSKPIGRQLITLTVPMLYAIVAIMSLGLIDSYFISFLGTAELAAIALIFPITAIVNSVALGLGMAISSLTSKLVGAQKLNSAARLITDGFYLTTVISLLTVALVAWQLEAIFLAVGANASTLPHIHEYMSIWLLSAPLLMITTVSSSTFRSIGDTRASAQIALTLTLTNLILDPLLILGIGPFPALGMAGAAWASLIAVLLSTILSLYQLGVQEKLLLLALPTWQKFKLHFQELSAIAVPAVLANTIVPLTSAALTRLVAEFGTDAVAGYGVGARIEGVSLLIVYALSSTLPMFIGQNLGANRLDRVHRATVLAFRFVLLFQLLVYVILAVGAQPIAAIFSDQPTVRETIVLFLWIVPLTYGVSGVIVLINVTMNVLGKPRTALYINVLRLLLFYLPLAWLGAKLYGLKGLFLGIALGNLLAWFMAHYFLRKTFTEQGVAPPALLPFTAAKAPA